MTIEGSRYLTPLERGDYNLKANATAALELLKQFEAYLLSKESSKEKPLEINIQADGWEDRIRQMYQCAELVARYTQIPVFKGLQYWAGNIVNSYLNEFDVNIGLSAIQGDRGYMKVATEEMKNPKIR